MIDHEDYNKCLVFVVETKERKARLESKKFHFGLTKAEGYELDACNGDLKLWLPQIEKYKKEHGINS